MTLTLILVLPRKSAAPRLWPRVQSALRASWAEHGPAIRGRVQPWEPVTTSVGRLSLEIRDEDAAILDAFVFVALPSSADAFLSRREVARDRLRPFLVAITDVLAPAYVSLGLWAAFLEGSKRIPKLSIIHEPRWVRDFLEIEPNQILTDVRPEPG